MKRIVAILALALVTLLSQSAVLGAQKKRAYKPSERQKQAEAQPAQPADAPAAGGTYEEEVQAAKDKRDRDLEAATKAETDRRKLEDRKAEIFGQYAAIVAALRDKYEQSVKDGTTPPPAPAKGKARTKAGRQPPPERSAETPPAKAKERPKKQPKNAAGSLADAEAKLHEENKRHEGKLDELNAQLQQAETSGNQREVRRVQKAIEKENNTYNSRKAILERKVRELGGSPAAAPTPAQ